MGQFAPGAWGFSPYANQGFGIQSLAQQPYASFVQQPYAQPFSTQSIGGYGIGALQPPQQILQQQLFQLQQLLQLVPVQLQQLQQLIQVITQQVHQFPQQAQAFGPAASGPVGFGVVAPAVAGQSPGHVM